jgi:hypothetical protein
MIQDKYSAVTVLAIAGTMNCRLSSLQRPLEFLSKVPMNCFHRSVFVKGIAAQFSACKIPYEPIKQRNLSSRHCVGNRFGNVEKHIPMPDCFFPPNGTFVFSILY